MERKTFQTRAQGAATLLSDLTSVGTVCTLSSGDTFIPAELVRNLVGVRIIGFGGAEKELI